jgi:hypothetical protein
VTPYDSLVYNKYIKQSIVVVFSDDVKIGLFAGFSKRSLCMEGTYAANNSSGKRADESLKKRNEANGTLV